MLDVCAFILPLGLLIIALTVGTRELLRRRHALWGGFCRHLRTTILVSAVLTLMLIDGPYVLDRLFDITSPGWKFWLQTFAGNWSPDSFPHEDPSGGGQLSPGIVRAWSPREHFLFAISAGLAFWINNLMVVALAGWVWRLAGDRRRAMTFAAALRLKESFARAAVLDLLDRFPVGERQSILELFDEAMAQAEVDLEKHLPNIEPAKAAAILSAMKGEAADAYASSAA